MRSELCDRELWTRARTSKLDVPRVAKGKLLNGIIKWVSWSNLLRMLNFTRNYYRLRLPVSGSTRKVRGSSDSVLNTRSEWRTLPVATGNARKVYSFQYNLEKGKTLLARQNRSQFVRQWIRKRLLIYNLIKNKLAEFLSVRQRKKSLFQLRFDADDKLFPKWLAYMI